MCDEPITELCKSERDGEVTSERQFALCVERQYSSDCEKPKTQMACHDLAAREEPTLFIEPLDAKCRVNRQFVIGV
jgi:hypothetical protein